MRHENNMRRESNRLGLKFGYGTNGFSNHRLDDVLTVLADLGYDGVALTLDHHHLDPFDANLARQVSALSQRLTQTGLTVVIETGARFLLDSRNKHYPTLVSGEGRDRRLDLLMRAIRIGSDLGSDVVHFWSGIKPPEITDEQAWEWLISSCQLLVEAASSAGLRLGIEPEPGMFLEDLAGYKRLRAALGSPRELGITLDLGHCHCLEDISVSECIRDVAEDIVNIQIEDMRRGVHEHLEFGEGEMDFPPVLRTLADINFQGLVTVELPRHSHDAPNVARRSLEFLNMAADLASKENAV